MAEDSSEERFNEILSKLQIGLSNDPRTIAAQTYSEIIGRPAPAGASGLGLFLRSPYEMQKQAIGNVMATIEGYPEGGAYAQQFKYIQGDHPVGEAIAEMALTPLPAISDIPGSGMAIRAAGEGIGLAGRGTLGLLGKINPVWESSIKWAMQVDAREMMELAANIDTGNRAYYTGGTGGAVPLYAQYQRITNAVLAGAPSNVQKFMSPGWVSALDRLMSYPPRLILASAGLNYMKNQIGMEARLMYEVSQATGVGIPGMIKAIGNSYGYGRMFGGEGMDAMIAEYGADVVKPAFTSMYGKNLTRGVDIAPGLRFGLKQAVEPGGLDVAHVYGNLNEEVLNKLTPAMKNYYQLYYRSSIMEEVMGLQGKFQPGVNEFQAYAQGTLPEANRVALEKLAQGMGSTVDQLGGMDLEEMTQRWYQSNLSVPLRKPLLDPGNMERTTNWVQALNVSENIGDTTQMKESMLNRLLQFYHISTPYSEAAMMDMANQAGMSRPEAIEMVQRFMPAMMPRENLYRLPIIGKLFTFQHVATRGTAQLYESLYNRTPMWFNAAYGRNLLESRPDVQDRKPQYRAYLSNIYTAAGLTSNDYISDPEGWFRGDPLRMMYNVGAGNLPMDMRAMGELTGIRGMNPVMESAINEMMMGTGNYTGGDQLARMIPGLPLVLQLVLSAKYSGDPSKARMMNRHYNSAVQSMIMLGGQSGVLDVRYPQLPGVGEYTPLNENPSPGQGKYFGRPIMEWGFRKGAGGRGYVPRTETSRQRIQRLREGILGTGVMGSIGMFNFSEFLSKESQGNLGITESYKINPAGYSDWWESSLGNLEEERYQNWWASSQKNLERADYESWWQRAADEIKGREYQTWWQKAGDRMDYQDWWQNKAYVPYGESFGGAEGSYSFRGAGRMGPMEPVGEPGFWQRDWNQTMGDIREAFYGTEGQILRGPNGEWLTVEGGKTPGIIQRILGIGRKVRTRTGADYLGRLEDIARGAPFRTGPFETEFRESTAVTRSLGKLGGFMKFAGPTVMAGFSLYQAYREIEGGYNPSYAISREAAGFGLGMAEGGAFGTLGAWIGGGIGTLIAPGPGTAIGAAIGGLLFGTVGGVAGMMQGQGLVSMFWPDQYKWANGNQVQFGPGITQRGSEFQQRFIQRMEETGLSPRVYSMYDELQNMKSAWGMPTSGNRTGSESALFIQWANQPKSANMGDVERLNQRYQKILNYKKQEQAEGGLSADWLTQQAIELHYQQAGMAITPGGLAHEKMLALEGQMKEFKQQHKVSWWNPFSWNWGFAGTQEAISQYHELDSARGAQEAIYRRTTKAKTYDWEIPGKTDTRGLYDPAQHYGHRYGISEGYRIQQNIVDQPLYRHFGINLGIFLEEQKPYRSPDVLWDTSRVAERLPNAGEQRIIEKVVVEVIRRVESKGIVQKKDQLMVDRLGEMVAESFQSYMAIQVH